MVDKNFVQNWKKLMSKFQAHPSVGEDDKRNVRRKLRSRVLQCWICPSIAEEQIAMVPDRLDWFLYQVQKQLLLVKLQQSSKSDTYGLKPFLYWLPKARGSPWWIAKKEPGVMLRIRRKGRLKRRKDIFIADCTGFEDW